MTLPTRPGHLRMAVLFSLACAGVTTAYPTIFPTGTTICKPDRAYCSYILISDHSTTGNHPDATIRATGTVPDDVLLIDMNGNVVHRWMVAPAFNKRSRLLPSGHLVYAGPNRTIFDEDRRVGRHPYLQGWNGAFPRTGDDRKWAPGSGKHHSL